MGESGPQAPVGGRTAGEAVGVRPGPESRRVLGLPPSRSLGVPSPCPPTRPGHHRVPLPLSNRSGALNHQDYFTILCFLCLRQLPRVTFCGGIAVSMSVSGGRGGGTLLRHAEARMTTPQLESSLVNEAGLFTNGCVGKARSSTAADGFPRSFNPGRGSIWALAPRVPTSSRYRELSRTEIRQARSNNQLSLQKKSCQQTSLVYKRACPVVSLCVALRVSPPICFLHAPSDSSSLLVKPLRHSLDCTMAAMKKAAMKKAMKAHAPAEAAPAKKTMKKAMKAKK